MFYVNPLGCVGFLITYCTIQVYLMIIRFVVHLIHFTTSVGGGFHMARWRMNLTPAAPLTDDQEKSMHMPTNPNFA